MMQNLEHILTKTTNLKSLAESRLSSKVTGQRGRSHKNQEPKRLHCNALLLSRRSPIEFYKSFQNFQIPLWMRIQLQ